MQTINLKQYYPFCTGDILVEVSDEIVEVFLLDKRAETARERRMFRYKAFYSLDCNDGIEHAAIGWARPSPETLLTRKEVEQEYQLTLVRLHEAIHQLPEILARRRIERGAILEGIFPLAPNRSGTEVKAFLIALF